MSQLLELIGSVSTVLTPLASLAAAVTAGISAARSVRNSRTIQQIDVKINGRFTELLDLTAKASRAEGILHEKERVEAVLPLPSPEPSTPV